MDVAKRLDIINSTVNVDKRLVKLFELIETDLLAKIVHSTQTIAPYKVSSSYEYSLFCLCIGSASSSEEDPAYHVAARLRHLIMCH